MDGEWEEEATAQEQGTVKNTEREAEYNEFTREAEYTGDLK